MGVQALYFSDRDGKEKAMANPSKLLFTSKKEADERDKMLELSDELRDFLQANVEGLPEDMAEKCALALASQKDLLQKALKKPSVLNAVEPDAEPEA